MSAALKQEYLSVEEYLADEELAEVKHEYLGGAVHAMAGANNRHNSIATNVLGLLFASLRGRPCRAFNSDTKVRIELREHTRFYYPDAMVVCQPSAEAIHYQESPVVIVEVLSESTRRVDLAEKRDAYQMIPSLKVLIFVESDTPKAVVYRRGESGDFGREDLAGLEAAIALPEIGAELRLSEIYEGMAF